MWPLVIGAGALWYLTRLRRNPDWITTNGVHRPIFGKARTGGDGRSGDATPYDDARLKEPPKTIRRSGTASSSGQTVTKRWSEMTPEEKRIARAAEAARNAELNAARRSAQASARGRKGAATRAAIARNRAASEEKTRIEAARMAAERAAREAVARAEHARDVAERRRQQEAARLAAIAARDRREAAQWARMTQQERQEAADEASQVSPEARRFIRAIAPRR